MSSAPSSTSSARPRPISRGSRAIGPPPGTRPAPTSHCDRMAFSRLAKRMSLASASSLPTPVARPRIDGDRHDRRAAEARQHVGQRLQAGRPGGSERRSSELGEEVVVGEEEAFDRAVEDHDLHVGIGLERRDDRLQLRDRLGPEDVQGRMVERHPPIGRRAPLEPDLARLAWRSSFDSFSALLAPYQGA